MVATSDSHGDWTSTSLFPDFPQTQTLTFSDLGLKSINVSLYTRFSPNPNPYSLSDLGLKSMRVWALGSLVR